MPPSVSTNRKSKVIPYEERVKLNMSKVNSYEQSQNNRTPTRKVHQQGTYLPSQRKDISSIIHKRDRHNATEEK